MCAIIPSQAEGTRHRPAPLSVKGESAGSYWTPNVDAVRLPDWPGTVDEEDDMDGEVIEGWRRAQSNTALRLSYLPLSSMAVEAVEASSTEPWAFVMQECG